MAGRLAGKVALISGAARGQGEVEGRLFAQEGAKVVLGDILVDSGRKWPRIFRSKEDKLHLFPSMSPRGDWQSAVETTVQTMASWISWSTMPGSFALEGVEATSMELWNQVIAVNQTGVWLGMKYAVQRAKSRRRIDRQHFLRGWDYRNGMAAAYHGTKGAVRILTKTAAIEYAKDHIRINSVHPGVVDTEMVRGLMQSEGMPALVAAHPLGRVGTSEDIAYGVLYLASDESSFVTGSELVIDGGFTAH